MQQNLSLSPAQIQYLKIGPKVGTSNTTTRQLQQSLNKFDIEGSESSSNLASIPKFSYGNFQNTVNNFGVLLHRNFVGTTTLHQAQKFGKMAQTIDRVMQADKDKVVDPRKTGQNKTFIDPRSTIKAIYQHNGHKFLITLKSFSIQSLQTNRIIQTLPLAYLKLIVTHVSSSKLVKSIETAMRSEGSNLVVIDYQKMESKVSNLNNNQQRYAQGQYTFERSGQQFSIVFPYVEIYHSQSDYRTTCKIDNKDLLQALDSDFDNVDNVINKYVNFDDFDKLIGSQNNNQVTEQKAVQQNKVSQPEPEKTEQEK